MKSLAQYLYITVGWLFLGLGVIGIFLPLLPTTPFVLLAAFCFSRGSATLNRWLLEQKTFGPMIRDWNQHGIIRRRVKWTSAVLIVLMIGYPVLFSPLSRPIKIGLVMVGIGVIGFIWSRPSQV
jgi:uncharacterized membrane protein YbaN (DUF454 family)